MNIFHFNYKDIKFVITNNLEVNNNYRRSRHLDILLKRVSLHQLNIYILQLNVYDSFFLLL